MARQRIVGKAVRSVETVMKETTRSHRYHTVHRKDMQVDTYIGYRLECGHVIDGSMGHGKTHVTCWHCECGYEPSGEWLELQASFVDM